MLLYSLWMIATFRRNTVTLSSERERDVFFLTTSFHVRPRIYICESEYGAFVEWYWQDKTEVLGDKPAPVPLPVPQISHGLNWDRIRSSAMRGSDLPTWYGIHVQNTVRWNTWNQTMSSWRWLHYIPQKQLAGRTAWL